MTFHQSSDAQQSVNWFWCSRAPEMIYTPQLLGFSSLLFPKPIDCEW